MTERVCEREGESEREVLETKLRHIHTLSRRSETLMPTLVLAQRAVIIDSPGCPLDDRVFKLLCRGRFDTQHFRPEDVRFG